MKYLIIILIVILEACSSQSPAERRIDEILGKKIDLSMFERVRYMGDTIPFKDILNEFDYISIVYLENECSPCYSKYIEWYKEMQDVEVLKPYTIFFVVKSRDYQSFSNNVEAIEHVDEMYPIALDPNYVFIDANKEIPRWIIDHSCICNLHTKAVYSFMYLILVSSELLQQTIKLWPVGVQTDAEECEGAGFGDGLETHVVPRPGPPGLTHDEEVAVGDRVLFKRVSATEVSDGDDKYLLMPFKDLIGKYVAVDSI